MPNEAANIRAQVQAEHPGATIEARVPKGIVHRLPNGQLHGVWGPRLHLDDGTEVDTDLDDANSPKSVPFTVTISNSGNRTWWPRPDHTDQFVAIDRPDRWVATGGGMWQALQMGTAIKTANSIEWDDTDWTIRFDVSGEVCRSTVTVKTAGFSPTGQFRFEPTAVGLTIDPDGTVQAEVPVGRCARPIQSDPGGVRDVLAWDPVTGEVTIDMSHGFPVVVT